MKKCPLLHAPCCKDNCQFYDEKKKCCSLVLSQQENYKNMKKQNTFLKVVAVALVGVLAVGVVAGYNKWQEEDKNPSDSSNTNSSSSSVIEPVEEPSWKDDGVLKILTIGNSFSVNSMQYVYQIAKASGIEKIELGNLYIGGCSLETHLNNAKNDSAAYTYYTNDSGTWNILSSYKISDVVKGNNWDFVSFQQASDMSGVANSYDDLIELMDIVEPLCTNENVEFAWHMTWAYQSDSPHGAFPRYDSNQLTMYNAIVSSVQEKIVPNERISKIIPNGTVIQNARTSYLGDTLTSDGTHLSQQGQILAGATMIAALIDFDFGNLDLSAVSSDMSFFNVVVESVKNALDKPFEVTQSTILEDSVSDDLSNLVELDCTLYKGQYWNSAGVSVNELLPGTSYWGTEKFTKETLPVGSKIVVASGWQYRPEGWINDAANSADTRPVVCTTSVVDVTEAWWGNWTTRAFNISKTDSSDLSSYSESDIRAVFKIYVPKTN